MEKTTKPDKNGDVKWYLGHHHPKAWAGVKNNKDTRQLKSIKNEQFKN